MDANEMEVFRFYEHNLNVRPLYAVHLIVTRGHFEANSGYSYVLLILLPNDGF